MATLILRIPSRCAAGLATQEIYRREGLLTRAQETGKYLESAVHMLKGLPNVIDIRNNRADGLRGTCSDRRQARCTRLRPVFFSSALNAACLLRSSGDSVPLSPPAHHREAADRSAATTLSDAIKARLKQRLAQ